MQVYIFMQSTIIGIEVFVLPLIFLAGGPFFIIPAIVDPGSDDIFFTGFYQVSNVKSKCGDAVFVNADMFSIHIKITCLPDAFKFYKDFLCFGRCRQYEFLAIPGYTGGMIADIFSKSIVFIPCIWQRHAFPGSIIE